MICSFCAIANHYITSSAINELTSVGICQLIHSKIPPVCKSPWKNVAPFAPIRPTCILILKSAALVTIKLDLTFKH